MSRNLSFWRLAATAAFVWASAAQAQESAAVTTPHATVTLASETTAVEPGKPFRLGLHFKLAKGWHIYWTNPGAAGEPPELDLDLPEGAKASDMTWPTPERVRQSDEVMSYAYLDEVLLPFTVTPPAGVSSFPIKAKASWLICEKICVPEQGELTLNLPVGRASPSAEAPLFAAADARIPRPSSDAATISGDGVLAVAGSDLSPDAVREAWFLPASWGAIDDLAPQALSVAPGKLSLTLKTGQAFDPKATLPGVLVLKDAAGRERDLTIVAAPQAGIAPAASAPAPKPAAGGTVPVQPDAAGAPAGGDKLGLLSALTFAFLGGLILNLMPCVFPILAIKAMSLAGLAGRDRGVVRLHAAHYTVGVLVAFGALGAILIVLRAAGAAAGWGFQFQSPAFVAAVAWLLFAIGLNLSGVFEIGGGWVGVGEGLTRRGGLIGSFFTGLLAVVVATPCTAPFMGAAIAASSTAAAPAALLIFLVMGLGLAAPYGAFALMPGLAAALPRPGRWMLILRQALAFPMYGAAVWLAWVVSQQAGADGALIVLSGAVLIGFAAWIFNATRNNARRGRAIGEALATAIALLALLTLNGLSVAPQAATAAVASEDAAAYTPDRLAALRAEGRPVFVNMTAAWCVTCLVNERVALSSDKVRDAFAKRNVAYLKGDWTRADPAISQFLKEHGRDGVPLYLLYPPHGDKPVVLPQILTQTGVLDELNRMGS
jgi:thiol:disulfide interchange protein/DsbC/DsbD-like thiol-disulfide interchange protein